VSNCFFGFSTRDAQLVVALRALSAAEAFRDVGADGLRRVSELCLVDQSTWRRIDQPIDFVRHLIGGIEDIEVAIL